MRVTRSSIHLLAALLLASSPAVAQRADNDALARSEPLRADRGYRVDIASARESDGSVSLGPRITGPAGQVVRFEVHLRSENLGASAMVTRSGSVRLDDTGSAVLAPTSLRGTRGERYEMEVRIFEGDRVVAVQAARA
jgi:hypothetical protein